MTNYKRFISYMYSYDFGIKKGNVGFARVETSDEQCKLTIHCTTRAIANKDCEMYLLKRSKSDFDHVGIGKASAKDGYLDIKHVFMNGDIPDAGFKFTETAGIVLMYSKDNYIAAKWDDSSVSYHEAEMLEESARAKAKSLKQAIKPEKIEQSQERSNRVTEVIAAEVPLEDSADTKLVEVPYEDIVVIEPEQSETVSADSMVQAEELREAPVETEEIDNTSQVKADSLNTLEEEEKKDDYVEISLDTESDKEPSAAVAVEEPVKEEEMVEAANYRPVSKPVSYEDHPSARAILNKFVRMYPFDDGEIAECVRLEPKDIGLLPMNTWILGNNSFLLHAYCNFRHLLFAKKLTREGVVYLLMVPGVLNRHEEQLAKMFGFENFKCSRRRSARSGEFGYWYLPIDFNV